MTNINKIIRTISSKYEDINVIPVSEKFVDNK